MSTETARSQDPSVLPADSLVVSNGPAVSLDADHDDTRTLTISKGQRVQNAVSNLVNSPRRRTSKIPASLQFPLIVLLSFSLSSLGYSFLNESTRGELATVTKAPESNFEVTLLAVWRILELGLGWFGNLDGYDLASLNVLSHGPSLFLVAAFYDISPWTSMASLAIDALSALGPFVLLRPLSETHVAHPTLPNSEIITDRNIKLSTGLLAGLIYGVTLFVAVKTYLGTHFVLYFEGITRIEPALNTKYGATIAALIVGLLGLAAQSFIFTPYETTPATVDPKTKRFDPVTATLADTLRWNLWGFSKRTQVVIFRTGVVALVTWIHTYLQCAMTVHGVEPWGAASYASIWSIAALATGAALELVGDA
ncbi:hypothetical protein GE09DRAFT_1055101 [Coniochaeta sp. 2T2.1]|nr:hypothetical protein GE09DRAFT_1055101 [Coniochaeta sp. 2T2.1]